MNFPIIFFVCGIFLLTDSANNSSDHRTNIDEDLDHLHHKDDNTSNKYEEKRSGNFSLLDFASPLLSLINATFGGK
jgi:hypothetical protein